MPSLETFLADLLAGRVEPLPDHDGARMPGEKTVAERKARHAFYSQIYDPKNFRPAAKG